MFRVLQLIILTLIHTIYLRSYEDYDAGMPATRKYYKFYSAGMPAFRLGCSGKG